jgi:RimJ/RimL family protein N-acetyltransferase
MSDLWTNPGGMVLRDQFVELRPVRDEDMPALFEATQEPQTFRYFLTWPQTWTPGHFAAWLASVRDRPGRVLMAVRDLASSRLAGCTAYLDIDPAHRSVEIGATWYGPAWRGTAINPACKRLLLAHAFDTAGAQRVLLKCDARNDRSRAAILKLGAVYEGTLRRNQQLPDGHRRDTALFSIMPEEWPGVKARLDQRLANAAGNRPA